MKTKIFFVANVGYNSGTTAFWNRFETIGLYKLCSIEDMVGQESDE